MNLKYEWIAKKIKPMLFAVVTIIFLTFWVYYIASDDSSPNNSKIDILYSSFIIAIVFYLSGWLALKIGQKLDDKIYDWQGKLCCFLFGPIMLIATVIEYLKRKHRSKYTFAEQLHKKDIFSLWDWFWERE